MEDASIYPAELLESLDFDKNHVAEYSPQILLSNPGPNLVVRPLLRSDYSKGYMDLLLSALYVRDNGISKEEFEERWDKMFRCGDSYYITVIEDTSINKIIGNCVLHIEYKFLQPSVKRGRIEDVGILESYRGRQLGKLLMDVTTLLCRKVGCFRVSLHCRDWIVEFYKKFGFYLEETENIMWLDKKFLQ